MAVSRLAACGRVWIFVVLAGRNLVDVDTVATRLMGFDPHKLKILSNSLSNENGFDFCLSNGEIEVVSNNPTYKSCLTNRRDPFLTFQCPTTWTGTMSI